MSRQRHFLGWDGPVAAKVRDFLIPPRARGGGPVDLTRTVVVVPTRHAGRRLREALVRTGPGRETGVIGARVVTPSWFMDRCPPERPEAGEALETAVWAEVLLAAKPADFPALLPHGGAPRDAPWALGAARLIRRLRHDLADGAWTIATVLDRKRNDLAEPERWSDLARLEGRYLRRLKALGRSDACAHRIRSAKSTEPVPDVERLVMAAVPDPSLLTVAALEALKDHVAVEILIHAPSERAEDFDEWGRPRPEAWRRAVVDIPDGDRNVLLAAAPEDQARAALDVLAAESSRFGPADLALGMPDADLAPALQEEFRARGLPPHDPSDRPAARHAVGRLALLFARLCADESYENLRLVLRHPDALAWLAGAAATSAGRLLTALDEVQNEQLPAGWPEVSPDAVDADRQALALALERLRAAVAAARRDGLASGVRALLRAVYADRTLALARPEDREFHAAAEAMGAVLDEARELEGLALRLDEGARAALLADRLAEAAYTPERGEAVLDLEGWLELAWNDAPLLVVTGMNEGRVPDGGLSDVFLPDSLRGALGLRDDALRLARDTFLLQTLVASRPAGRAVFIAGKTGAGREPLLPSRLLFRGPDDGLPARAARLFDDSVTSGAESAPAAFSVRLDPSPPAAAAERLDPDVLYVTAFRGYLACPFRHYLGRVLGLAALDDRKQEPDALDFGSLVHHALHGLYLQEELRACARARDLEELLARRAAEWARARFGPSPPLAVTVILDAARQRLRHAARVQAQLAAEGWEIVRGEAPVEVSFAGLRLRGRVDRVDRHRESGRTRIIDYKTSDKSATPAEAHLEADRDEEAPPWARVSFGGKPHRWVDLQLPLYRVLLPDAGDAELAYFNLPKAVGDTGLSLWEGFTPALLDSAAACAREVVRLIQTRVFWPPSEGGRYDDYAALITGDPEVMQPPRFAPRPPGKTRTTDKDE